MSFDRIDQIVEVGETYSIPENTTPNLCNYGFHGSVRALDAIKHAVGSVVCRVEIYGDVVFGHDKLVGRHRKVLWMADAVEVLKRFSKWNIVHENYGWRPPTAVECLARVKSKAAAQGIGTHYEWHAAFDAEWDRQNTKLERMLNVLAPKVTR